MSSKILNAVLLFIIGIIVGTVATIAQQSTVTIAHASLPWGVVAALGAVATLLIGLRLVNPGRLQACASAVGAIVAIALFTVPSAGGSVLIPANTAGYAWVIGSVSLSLIIVLWPNLGGRTATTKATVETE